MNFTHNSRGAPNKKVLAYLAERPSLFHDRFGSLAPCVAAASS
jgi:hypothetical protein